jgi:hypothetical protein
LGITRYIGGVFDNLAAAEAELTLPKPTLDESSVVDRLAAQVASVLERMSARYSHVRLAELLSDCLRRGDLAVTVKAIEAAERNDDWLADVVLRKTYAEMDTNHQPMTDQLRAFGQRAVLRPPVARGRGRDEYAVWSRNINICTLILSTCCEFNLRPTRSGSARRSRTPSGVSLVRAALARNGINIEEKTIQQDIWFGLPGALVRQAFAHDRP